MPTECSAKPMGFVRVDGRAVVADFEAERSPRTPAGCCSGRPIGPSGSSSAFRGLLHRWPGGGSVGPRGDDAGRAAGVRHRARLRGPDRPRSAASRPGARGGAWSARGAARALRAARRQEHANRLEHGGAEADHYRRIAHDGGRDRGAVYFVDLFLDAHRARAKEIVLDLERSPPTTRCTATRRGGSSTATTTATATCRSTSSAAATCWRPSSGAPTSTPRPARSRRWRASSGRSAAAGHGCGSSCAATAVSPAKR